MSFQNNPHILFWAVCNLVLHFFETPLYQKKTAASSKCDCTNAPANIFWVSVSNAKFTLHDFSLIFHSPTGFDKSPTNARHWSQIGTRSREWQSPSVNDQRCNLRESPMRRRHPWNIGHAKYLEKYIGDDLQPMREQDTGQREAHFLA